jgi:predicted nucleic acid-binding Zn ribbon protein
VTPPETTEPVRPPGPSAADAGATGVDAADVPSEGTDLAEALVNRARLVRERVGARNQPATGASRSRRRAPGAGWSGPADDERDPQPLDTSVARLVDEHGWGQDIAVHAVVARWEQVVGPDVAAHVRVERYTDGVVTLRTDSTAWATQMRLLAAALVRRFNEETGAGMVSRVVVLGPHTPSWRKGPRSVPGRGPRDTYG